MPRIKVNQEEKLKEFLYKYKSKYKFNIHFSKNNPSLFYIKWHNKIIYSEILLKILSHQFQNISAKSLLDLNALKFIHKYNLMNRIPRFIYKHYIYSDESKISSNINIHNMVIDDNVRNSLRVIAMTDPIINNNKYEELRASNEFYKNTFIIGTGKNKREYTFETLNKYGIFPEQYEGDDSK